MAVFELVMSLLFGGVGLALLAPRLGVPWPALLALAGVALAFVPGVPEVALDPELALALFVAPVLLDAAYDASPRDLRQNWRPVASLVLVAVVLTVAAVAVLARWFEPSLPWPAAVALGHRRTTRCRGRGGRVAPGALAAPGHGDPRGREPAQRRVGVAHLPAGSRCRAGGIIDLD